MLRVGALLALATVAMALDWPAGDSSAVASRDAAMGPAALPDLVVESIDDAQQPFDCVTPAGVKVTVRNIGGGPAGASTTRVSTGAQSASLPTQALAAGEAVILYSTVEGLPIGDTYTAVADFSGVVAESDETNNSLVAFLSLGTFPTCTPTPTSTPAAVGGIAALPDGGLTPLETAEAHGAAWGAVFVVAVAAGLLAVGGVAWYVRRRA